MHKGAFGMKVSLFKKVVGLIILSCLFLVAACATGTVTTKPYQPQSPQQQDPMYWQQLQDWRGISG